MSEIRRLVAILVADVVCQPRLPVPTRSASSRACGVSDLMDPAIAAHHGGSLRAGVRGLQNPDPHSGYLPPVRPCQGSGPGSRPAATSVSRLR
jgi:hypothetical protein